MKTRILTLLAALLLAPVSITVDGAVVQPGGFCEPSGHVFGAAKPFTAKKPFWSKSHYLTLRATGPTAQLRISDWAKPDAPRRIARAGGLGHFRGTPAHAGRLEVKAALVSGMRFLAVSMLKARIWVLVFFPTR